MTVRLPVGKPLTWNEAAIAALGTVSDVKLGKMLGIDNRTVQAKRRALGIAAWRQPKDVLTITCVVCGKKTQVSGRRKSRLRTTCPPTHRFTRAGQPSDCEKQLRSRILMLTHNQPLSARGLVKKLGGSSVIRLLDD